MSSFIIRHFNPSIFPHNKANNIRNGIKYDKINRDYRGQRVSEWKLWPFYSDYGQDSVLRNQDDDLDVCFIRHTCTSPEYDPNIESKDHRDFYDTK